MAMPAVTPKPSLPFPVRGTPTGYRDWFDVDDLAELVAIRRQATAADAERERVKRQWLSDPNEPGRRRQRDRSAG
jgi:hypothetical protein